MASLGPDDWRQRDDVRYLPSAEREDLELWLMEQAYLYCRALEDRPDSPDDWRRALKILDAVSGPAAIPAFAAIRHRLGAKLGAEASPSPPVSTRSPAPTAAPWVNEYLLGVVAECEPESELASTLPRPPTAEESADRIERRWSAKPTTATQRAAARALNHYNNFLALHPDSYWGTLPRGDPLSSAWVASRTSPKRPVTWSSV